MILIIIIILVSTLLYSFILFIIAKYWNKLRNPFPSAPSSIFISVIIPARNEEKNIKSCIESILKSQYPKESYELIVMNDHSEDKTSNFVSLYSEVKLVDVKMEGKKNAITQAINEVVTGELIVTLDADCVVSTQWLSSFNNCYQATKADIIVGPVFVDPKPKTIISYFECIDTINLMAVTYYGLEKKKFYLANGANLCFTKRLFNHIKGYEGNEQLASGDDVFLLNKAKNIGSKITYLKNIFSVVKTKPQADFLQLLSQRKRWASKTNAYANNFLIVLQVMVFIVNALPIVLFLLSFILGFSYLACGLILLAIKIVIDYIYIQNISTFFNQKFSIINFIRCSFINVFVYNYMSIVTVLKSKYSWKGRELK